MGPTSDLIRGPPAGARQGWPFLLLSLPPSQAQGDTWLVISPACPRPLGETLRNSLFRHGDPREQCRDGGGQGVDL